MNKYFLMISGILILNYFFDTVISYFNVKNINSNLPDEFIGYYNEENYSKSQSYLKTNTIFNIFNNTIFLLLTILFIYFGGFNYIDELVRDFVKQYDIESKIFQEITLGLFFIGIIIFINYLLELPFGIYNTFVIEEKYGFNKTTIKTFIGDNIKSILLTIIIGGPLLLAVLYFFEKYTDKAWWISWMAVTVFQITIMLIAPKFILPLFNKFKPLADGELKEEIKKYAESQNYKLKGIFSIDGSRRTTKSNAFFTGFGKWKRIALFDTLIKNHNVDEIISILAHETGHFKKKHIYIYLFINIIILGATFYFLSFMIENKYLFKAFKMNYVSVYASIIFFGFLYSPVSRIFSIIMNYISRKNEYQADKFAVETTDDRNSMIEALKKLSVNNLSNLTPHPLKVFVDYSHPPILERINRIKCIK